MPHWMYVLLTGLFPQHQLPRALKLLVFAWTAEAARHISRVWQQCPSSGGGACMLGATGVCMLGVGLSTLHTIEVHARMHASQELVAVMLSRTYCITSVHCNSTARHSW